MRRQGPITIRHIVVAVLVVVVINAQLTWWIVFVLHLNRNQLELERERLMLTARVEASRVEAEIAAARDSLTKALLGGAQPGSDPVPEQFVDWHTAPPGDDCATARLADTREIELGVTVGSGCVTGIMAEDWTRRILDVGNELDLVKAGADGNSGVRLAPPFEEFEVRTSPEVWEAILSQYRRRIVMMVSEGVFFAVLVFVLIGLLWRTFRREVELQRQHRNFLSAITHELKSPLASMRLALETVVSGRASAEVGQRFLANALVDTERLQGLVQKVLEATRYGEGGPQISLRRTNLSAIVEETATDFTRTTLASGVRVGVDIAAGIYGDVDDEAMAIAVSNLLENAVKYGGDPPRVELGLVLRGDQAVIEVCDNGHGIPEEDAGLIYQRFYRGGDEMTRTTRGTGLGLYLVQQIIEAHGGKIEVAESGPSGTTFRISLSGFDVSEDRV